MLDVRGVFDVLYASMGPQHWWPAQTDYEMIAGAVLTQNTAWRNVEKALDNLRAAGALTPGAVMAMDMSELADHLRPAGYYNVKAGRLRRLTGALLHDGGIDAWRAWSTETLRRRLLSINGVGEETADCILLYALDRPVFVVDAYTRRIFSRLGLVGGDETYRRLAAEFEGGLPADAVIYNEYHALIVSLGNRVCRPRPRCDRCPLVADCPTATGRIPGSRHAPESLRYG